MLYVKKDGLLCRRGHVHNIYVLFLVIHRTNYLEIFIFGGIGMPIQDTISD